MWLLISNYRGISDICLLAILSFLSLALEQLRSLHCTAPLNAEVVQNLGQLYSQWWQAVDCSDAWQCRDISRCYWYTPLSRLWVEKLKNLFQSTCYRNLDHPSGKSDLVTGQVIWSGSTLEESIEAKRECSTTIQCPYSWIFGLRMATIYEGKQTDTERQAVGVKTTEGMWWWGQGIYVSQTVFHE